MASRAGGWLVPGFSLHQEFAELRAAGLTPLQVLQAATLTGAQFAGREYTPGTVEPGKWADLVLLDANPLEDVRNLGRIASVVLRGRHFPRAKLDRMLQQVAAGYAAQAPWPQAALEDPRTRRTTERCGGWGGAALSAAPGWPW